MTKYLGSLAAYPARRVAVGYLLLIGVGTALLAMPISHAKTSEPIRLLDAVFTATSATCVTGLTIRSTGNDFSLFGQIVILGLLQIGGIGIMTITTLASVTFWAGESVRQRAALAETLGLAGLTSGQILRRILLVTVCIEAVGAAALWIRFSFETDSTLAQSGYSAVFHSISAFCNAGFGLHDDSLCRYVGDPVVNATIILLIIVGGLGYPTIEDMRRNLRGPRGLRWSNLRLQSKVVLAGTAILLVVGTLVILLLEWNHSLEKRSIPEALLAAAFQATTPRTAGFNTLEIPSLTETTLFVMILLMIVGGAPCSTAGGAKISTVGLVVLNAWCRIRGRSETTVFRRTLERDLVGRATALVLLYLTVATMGILLLLTFESRDIVHRLGGNVFMNCVFEAFSALGTVGLSASTGTGEFFSAPGKIVLILLMYIGRIGPISLAIVISRETRAKHTEYAREGLLIG